MKVILKKEAEYEFNEEKYTAIPSEVFLTLVGEPEKNELLDNNLPKLMVFENKTDFLANVGKYEVNYDRNMYVSPRGQIFCFLKEYGTADTEENKGE